MSNSVAGGVNEVYDGLESMVEGAGHAAWHATEAVGDSFATGYHYIAAGPDWAVGDTAGCVHQNALGHRSSDDVDAEGAQVVTDLFGPSDSPSGSSGGPDSGEAEDGYAHSSDASSDADDQ